MQRVKSDFELPFDVKNDLMYCQRALTSHILIHQKIASCLSIVKMPEGRLQKSLKSIEKEIIDIGDEQKLLFNRLRFYIDYHQITKNAKQSERGRLTNYVRDELRNFTHSKPINVHPRLTESALYAKYFQNDTSMDDESSLSRGHSSSNSVSDDIKTETISGSDDEHMEILLQPDDIRSEQKVYAGPRQKVSKRTTVIPFIPGQPTELTVKCSSPLSSSQSSNASSASSSVEVEPLKNEVDLSELGQESFLRSFSLGTPAYTEYLMNRRPQRKKRHCTSTERMDFLYGKFELFERQFSKRNTRQFLYSPPATRAKRRVGSNGSNPPVKEVVPPKRAKGIKTNASSSSSISSNG